MILLGDLKLSGDIFFFSILFGIFLLFFFIFFISRLLNIVSDDDFFGVLCVMIGFGWKVDGVELV